MNEPEQPQKMDSSYVTAMSHFYRGEIGRIMQWRARIDNTTNWAITTTTTIFTVAFSVRDVPHIIFAFNLCIVSIMLWIEARRYRFYDAFRARVRMLEAHFLVPVLMYDKKLPQSDWRKQLSEDLILPSFKISALEAIGRRLKRNYVFIYLTILAAWVTKVFLHAKVPIASWRTFYDALHVNNAIPGWAVLVLLVMTILSVVSLTIWTALKTPGEFSDLGPRRRWNI